MSYQNLRVACACILVASTCALSDAVGQSNVHKIDIGKDRTRSAQCRNNAERLYVQLAS